MIGFNGGLIGKDRTPSPTAAVGVWTLDEQIKEQRNDLWPIIAIQYRYVKWTITAIRGPGTDTQVADFNLRIGASNISMSSAVVTIDPASADGVSNGTPLSNLIDNNSATKWFTNITGTKALVFDMGSPTLFDGYQWVTGNDADGRDPVSWTVAGSVAGVNYTTLDTQTNFATTTSRQTVVGPFTFA